MVRQLAVPRIARCSRRLPGRIESPDGRFHRARPARPGSAGQRSMAAFEHLPPGTYELSCRPGLFDPTFSCTDRSCGREAELHCLTVTHSCRPRADEIRLISYSGSRGTSLGGLQRRQRHDHRLALAADLGFRSPRSRTFILGLRSRCDWGFFGGEWRSTNRGSSRAPDGERDHCRARWRIGHRGGLENLLAAAIRAAHGSSGGQRRTSDRTEAIFGRSRRRDATRHVPPTPRPARCRIGSSLRLRDRF